MFVLPDFSKLFSSSDYLVPFSGLSCAVIALESPDENRVRFDFVAATNRLLGVLAGGVHASRGGDRDSR